MRPKLKPRASSCNQDPQENRRVRLTPPVQVKRESLDVWFRLPDGPQPLRLEQGFAPSYRDDILSGTPIGAMMEVLGVRTFPVPQWDDTRRLVNRSDWLPGAYLKMNSGPYAKVLSVGKCTPKPKKYERPPEMSDCHTFSFPQYFGVRAGFGPTVPRSVYNVFAVLLLSEAGVVELPSLTADDSEHFTVVATELFERVREGKCRPDKAIALCRLVGIVARLQQVQTYLRGLEEQLEPTALTPEFFERVQHIAAHPGMLRALLVPYAEYIMECWEQKQTRQKQLANEHFERMEWLKDSMQDYRSLDMSNSKRWKTYGKTYVKDLFKDAVKLGLLQRAGQWAGSDAKQRAATLWAVSFAGMTPVKGASYFRPKRVKLERRASQ